MIYKTIQNSGQQNFLLINLKIYQKIIY